jgi:hypothetical protein
MDEDDTEVGVPRRSPVVREYLRSCKSLPNKITSDPVPRVTASTTEEEAIVGAELNVNVMP